jgi:transcription antitermination factor NusG
MPPCFTCSPWYVAATVAGRERQLASAFARLSIPTFLPTFQASRQRTLLVYDGAVNDYVEREQRYYQESVLFQGYLFVGMNEAEWARMKTRLGVAHSPRWVDFGDGPVTMAAGDLQGLAEAVESHNEQIERRKTMKAGDEVRLVTGPFANHVGLFSRDTNERVFVLLRFLGADRLIECREIDVEAV